MRAQAAIVAAAALGYGESVGSRRTRSPHPRSHPYADHMRWFVDGMNVIGTRPDGWWRDRHAAMVRLVDALERWAAEHGDDVTVVFEQPPRPPIRSSVIEVAHAPRPRANSGDFEIVRRLGAEADLTLVRVVTSDHWLADQARVAGASVYGSAAFAAELER